MLKEIADKLKFTESEIKIILFVVLITIVGLTGYYLKYNNDDVKLAKFDYSKQDSIFNSIGSKSLADDTLKKDEKGVDSEQELLDFSVDKNDITDKSVSDKFDAKIDLNRADKSSLIKLPGIGNKTAERVIEYRKLNGGFKNIKDIMNVKGIGQAKFKKIKSFIIVE